jgi:hypothetical protein
MPIQFRRNTAAAAATSNRVLAAGEPGFETDTNTLKIGDGTTAWNDLDPVSGGDPADASETVKGIVELATTAETTTGTDTVRAVTPAGVKAAIDALIAAAPGALDTLNELAAALGDDPNFATTVTNALAAKAPLAGSKVIQFAASDETTPLTTGTGKISFRVPYAMTLTAIRISLTTAQTSGSILTVDINVNGVSILSTKLTIDNGEKTSVTAAIQAVISNANIPDDAEVSVDIDGLGDGTAAGLKGALIGE